MVNRPSGETLLNRFEKYLFKEKGFKEETVNRHLENLGLFIDIYLEEYEMIHPFEVTGSDIEEYLGNWYIRKVINAKSSHIFSILSSIKKFYTYLYGKGNIPEEQYKEIISVCKRHDKFKKRFETFQYVIENMDENFELMEEWVNWEDIDYESDYDMPGKNAADKASALFSEIITSEEFTLVLNSLPGPITSLKSLPEKATAFLRDFNTFLDYCSENSGMKVSKKHYALQRKHIFAINDLLSNREELKPYVLQWQARFINLFYQLAKNLHLITFDDKFSLRISPDPIEEFRSLSPVHRLVLCLFALWEIITWGDLYSPHAIGRSEIELHQRAILSEAFADATPDFEYDFEKFISQYYNSSYYLYESFTPHFRVIPERIIPYLEAMGLVKAEYGLNYIKKTAVTKISIPELGKGIFTALYKLKEYYYKKEEEEG